MCRFAVRQPGAAPPPAAEAVKLEAPLDLESLFEHGADDLDASDLALLALFSGNNNAAGGDASAGSSSGAPATEGSNTVVMGQVLAAPATAQPALAVPAAAAAPPAVPTNPVQQLQFQAVMQHQAAIMQNPQAYPAAAQMYQQAILAQQQQAAVQQHMLAQQQAVAAVALPPLLVPAPAPVLLGKRGKTQQEVEEQTERIKKRRRESAQRSRQRKNAYMKSLEMENRALKLENERLRLELSKSGGGGGGGTAVAVRAPGSSPASADAAPKASSGSVSRREPSAIDDYSGGQGISDHGSMSDEEDDLCDPAFMITGVGGLAGSAAAELAAAGCCDPLELMPTADLLNFAF
ncbi:hypothetical protein ABPG75_001865 [Micractinium tetrahymenae]